MTETESLNLVDPFEGQSVLSLFPRTIRDSRNTLKSKGFDDLESVHQHMKSMALRSPDKHFEKARPIVDGISEFLNTKESAKEKDNPQERRPALARKRARFSLKPDTSQPSTTVEPNFEIDQLQDPEELFAAFDKLENTRKEIKRQRGGEDLNEATFSINARRRRPEISGRRVSYKHHDYSMHSKKDTTSSQETLEHDGKSPRVHDAQQKTINLNQESEEEELAGSVAKSESRVNKLFDELICSDIDKLDGNDALSLLKDRLNFKSIDIDDLHLPDFHDVGRNDFVSPGKNLLKDQNQLSGIGTVQDGLRRKTPGKQKRLSHSPVQPLSSPTPPRSPFLAMSTFAKRVLNSISSIDPFSAHDTDSSPTTSSIEIIGGRSDPISKGKELPVSGTTDSLAKEDTNTAGGAVSQEASIRASINLSHTSISDKLQQRVGTSLTESPIGLEDREPCDNMEEMAVNNNVIGPHADTTNQTKEGFVKDRDTEDIVQKATSLTETNLNVEDVTDTNVQVEDAQQKEASCRLLEANIEVSATENLKIHQSQSDQTGTNATEDIAASRPSRISDDFPEQHIQESPRPLANKRKKTTRTRQVNQGKRQQSLADQTHADSTEDNVASQPSQMSDNGPEEQNEEQLRTLMNKRKKTTRQADQSKRRNSLAGGGSSWMSGVRRSKRVRYRPLEYWKGERFLYGRVHNSLPTVIGLKYISPTKDNGKPGFKVESYVSDQYKDLVDLVSRH